MDTLAAVEVFLIGYGVIVILTMGISAYKCLSVPVRVNNDQHLQERLDQVRNDESQAFIDRGQS